MVILFRHFLSYLAYKTQVLFRVSLLVSWYFLEIPLLLQERVDEKSLYKCYQVQFCYYCAARWAQCTISFWSKKSPNSVGAFVHIGNCIPILSTIRPFLFEVCHLQAYFMLKWPTSQLLMWCLKKWPNCAQNWYRNTLIKHKPPFGVRLFWFQKICASLLRIGRKILHYSSQQSKCEEE